MSTMYRCHQCGEKVKEEERVAHIIADHRNELKIHSNPCGTPAIVERMYKRIEKHDP